MTAPISTAELLQGDFSAHTPMMQQYLGVTSSTNAGAAFEAILLDPVPSWSPSRARQTTSPPRSPSSPLCGITPALRAEDADAETPASGVRTHTAFNQTIGQALHQRMDAPGQWHGTFDSSVSDSTLQPQSFSINSGTAWNRSASRP